MITEQRIKDYPDLLKRDSFIINKNDKEYLLAKTRQKSTKDIEDLKLKVQTIEQNLQLILTLLQRQSKEG